MPGATNPELGARLVVLAVEVGGGWSPETQSFLSQLASARARAESPLMRRRAEQAWRFWWGALLSCSAARAVAMSLWAWQEALRCGWHLSAGT